MEIKILQVFYDKNGLPYKDKERAVHYPITSGTFLGSSNTTQIRFYYDRLDELNESTFVAISKLPNGRIGSEILESEYDSELEENYAVLNLSQFYTQYKGDVYISLQGYEGGVRVEQDENGIYSILGTPTIQATGSIRMYIAYAPTFIGSGQTENVTLQRVLAELSTKLGIRQESLHVEELPTVGNPNIWYVINDDPNDETKANIYIWNATTQTYVWVGDNTLNLGNYYTQEQGEQFESDIDNRVESVESELSSVAQGSPKGVYATLSDLETAYPTGTTGIYVVSANGHWYYWNGSAWTDGGVYQASLNDKNLSSTSTNALQNKIVTENINSLFNLDEFILKRTIGYSSNELVAGYIGSSGNISGGASSTDANWKRTEAIEIKNGDVIRYFGVAQPVVSTIAFFDASGTFISGVISSAEDKQNFLEGIIEPPSNAKFVFFTFTKQSSYAYYLEQIFYIYNKTLDNSLSSESNSPLKNKALTNVLGDAIKIRTFDKDSSELKVGFMTTSGAFQSGSGWRASDFIEINEKSSISYLLPGLQNVGSICYYDSEKEFISCKNIPFATSNANEPVVGNEIAPANARYLRFTFALGTSYSFIDSQYVKIIDFNIDKLIENYYVKISEYNLTSLSDYVNGFIIQDGTVTADANWRTSDFIEVEEGQKINFNLYVTITGSLKAVMLAYYDTSKNFVSTPIDYSSNYTGYIEGEETIPSGVKYVRFTFGVNYSLVYFNIFDSLVKLVTKTDEVEKEQEYVYNYKEFPYGYKKINLIGDSITQGTQCTTEYDDCYASILRKMLNIELGGKLNYGFVSAYTSLSTLKFDVSMLTTISETNWQIQSGSTECFGNVLYYSSTVGALYKMSLAKKFNYIKLAYVKGYTGTAKVSIYDNGVETDLLTIDSSNATIEPAMSNAIDISSYSASAQIWVTLVSGTFHFSGFELITDTDYPTFNNYAMAGAGVNQVTGTLLDKETDCDLLIYAMGANETVSQIATKLNAISPTIVSKSCNKLVLCPCCKTSAYDRYGSIEKMRAWAKDINADFLSMYEILPKDTSGSEPYNTLSSVMYDHVHPNNKGHALIAEAVADKIKLSTKSKDLEELLYQKFELHY